MNITIYTLRDSGLPLIKAKNLFDMVARYVDPFHVQVIRPVVLKNKLTDTTMTMRAFKLSQIDNLVQHRLIHIGRSKLSNWIELARLVEAFKKKESINETKSITK